MALACLGVGVVACGPSGAAEDAPGDVESAWGLLDDVSLRPESPHFLINKARGQSFRVCLPRYMATALPGIESEIYAAINVWASYLGRSIPVEIVTKDLPRARPEQSLDELGVAYQASCGSGFDVVMGLAKVEGAAVGITGVSYSYTPRPDGTRRITAFSRYLFLRDYDLVPTPGPAGQPERWESLATQDGRARSGSELLSAMLTRSDTRYAAGGTYLALPVLTHEYGHVWGLCDQYEGGPGCDPRNSSSHPVEASIMGARSGTERVFLTDDDIEGVRVLAAKPGFAHDWGSPRTDAPLPIPHRPVELARIESVRRAGSDLVVRYGVVTSIPARFTFEVQAAGEQAFTPLASELVSAEPVDIPNGEMTIRLGEEPGTAYRVRLIVTPQGGAPVTTLGSEP